MERRSADAKETLWASERDSFAAVKMEALSEKMMGLRWVAGSANSTDIGLVQLMEVMRVLWKG